MTPDHLFSADDISPVVILPGGLKQVGEVCVKCGYRRTAQYTPDGDLDLFDVWITDVLTRYVVTIPTPTCPPAREWKEAAEAVKRMQSRYEEVSAFHNLSKSCQVRFKTAHDRAEALCESLVVGDAIGE